jgi:hypothetical protein
VAQGAGKEEMKIGFVTTTIQIPVALAVFAKTCEHRDVNFFVVGDKKTPEAVLDFCDQLHNCDYIGVGHQVKYLKYKCSELIGWNCIQRRAIGVLEALKAGSEIIIVWDDDNLALNEDYLLAFEGLFDRDVFSRRVPFHGLAATGAWFDPGELLVPKIKHRGYPLTAPSRTELAPVVDAKIGMAEGLILGDTDMDAITRIASMPTAYGVAEIGRAGVVTDPRKTWTVCNTQNTAYLRELAPAMFCMPGLGRMDDIKASLICQRVMAERQMHVHFGEPFVYQQRNEHDWLTDLKEEMAGMEDLRDFANYLRQFKLPENTVTQQCRALVTGLYQNQFLTERSLECAEAFYEDCESVL